MDAPHFAIMKRGSRLVNTARGKLIDEEALVTALESEHLVSASLGVHYNEPTVNQKLAKMENVQLLSRTAGASIKPHIGFERLGVENILSFFSMGKTLTAVNWLRSMPPLFQSSESVLSDDWRIKIYFHVSKLETGWLKFS